MNNLSDLLQENVYCHFCFWFANSNKWPKKALSIILLQSGNSYILGYFTD